MPRGVYVLSLFSGVGGFDLGLERAGMEIVGQCEIDPFASKVLAKHWPEVTRYDDVRHVGCRHVECGGESVQRLSRGACDLVCGGFPCQDLSVAGKRAGLAGERSGLWFEFHRILSELRPSVALIENVPGLLSSNGGRDFGVILRGLDELWPGRWGWAVLDSQHFGVPQRRRRLYVIAGPPRERIAQILSLCEGGDWHPAKGRTQGQDVARPLGASATSFGGQRYDLDNETYIPLASATYHHGGIPNQTVNGDNGFLIPSVTAVRTAQTGSNGWGVNEEGTAYTLDGADGQAVSTAAAVRRLTPVECERLQGFPDDWTKLDDSTPDGPRYKAMGNAVTVPVIEYLGRRILEVLS